MTPSGMNDAGGDSGAPDLAVIVGAPKDDAKGDKGGKGDLSALDCVPVSALATPDADNNQQLATPEPGDPVSYQVEGTIDRIEGELAYVKRKSVNGEDINESAADEANEGLPGQGNDDAGDSQGGDSDYADLEKSANGVNL